MTQSNTNIGYTTTLPSAWQHTPTLSQDNCPTYQFRSTSTITPVVGTRSYTSTPSYSPVASKPYRAKSEWEDVEDDDPIGVFGGPIGEPLVLILMAVLYIFYIKSKKIREKFAHVIKKQ